MNRSWKPVFRVCGSGDKWCGNAQRFASRVEAECSAQERWLRWTAASEWDVQESEDEPNYRWDNEHGDVRLADQPTPKELAAVNLVDTGPATIAALGDLQALMPKLVDALANYKAQEAEVVTEAESVKRSARVFVADLLEAFRTGNDEEMRAASMELALLLDVDTDSDTPETEWFSEYRTTDTH